MKLVVDKIINYSKGETLKESLAQFGFHDRMGRRFVIDNKNNWVGQIGENGELLWTAGETSAYKSEFHIHADIVGPHYICAGHQGEILLTCGKEKRIYQIKPEEGEVSVFIDLSERCCGDIGNCEVDCMGNIWINEITGCRICQFNQNGKFIRFIGNGQPGFNKGEVSFDDARFSWIYDIRRGADGFIYILDSKNYSIRSIDAESKSIKIVAGTGESGYSGDGGPPAKATLGSNNKAHFDGPWAITVDHKNNIWIGDTQNKAIRVVKQKENTIDTMAGGYVKRDESLPAGNEEFLKINLKLISSLDYYDDKLYVPIWNNKLIVFKVLS